MEKLLQEKLNLEKQLSITRKQLEEAVKADHEFGIFILCNNSIISNTHVLFFKEVLQGKINTHMRYMDHLETVDFSGTRDELILAIQNVSNKLTCKIFIFLFAA